MARLQLRVRVRTLLVLIALLALGLGGYRWWLDRREILKMAKWHEQAAKRYAGLLELENERFRDHEKWYSSDLKHASEMEDIKGRSHATKKLLAKLRGEPFDEEQPAVSEAEMIRRQLQINRLGCNGQRLFWIGTIDWHRSRASELRSKRVFVLSRERLRDWRRAEEERQRWGRLMNDEDRSMIDLFQFCAAAEEAAAKAIENNDSGEAAAKNPQLSERVSFHRKLAAQHQIRADDQRSLAAQDPLQKLTGNIKEWFTTSVPFDPAAQADYRKLGLLRP